MPPKSPAFPLPPRVLASIPSDYILKRRPADMATPIRAQETIVRQKTTARRYRWVTSVRGEGTNRPRWHAAQNLKLKLQVLPAQPLSTEWLGTPRSTSEVRDDRLIWRRTAYMPQPLRSSNPHSRISLARSASLRQCRRARRADTRAQHPRLPRPVLLRSSAGRARVSFPA